jgi:hypothetical protein
MHCTNPVRSSVGWVLGPFFRRANHRRIIAEGRDFPIYRLGCSSSFRELASFANHSCKSAQPRQTQNPARLSAGTTDLEQLRVRAAGEGSARWRPLFFLSRRCFRFCSRAFTLFHPSSSARHLSDSSPSATSPFRPSRSSSRRRTTTARAQPVWVALRSLWLC